MPPLMNLPAYSTPNALINFDPMVQGIDAYQKGAENVRRVGVARNAGNALMSGDYAGAMSTAMQGDRPDLAGLAMQAKAHASQEQSQALDREHKTAMMMGGVAQRVLDLHKAGDTAGAQTLYSRISAHPNMAQALAKHGIDPNDHVGASQFLMAQAAGYRDPLEQEARRAGIDAQRSMTNLHNLQASQIGTPEVVRQLRAAGVDPNSPQGREIILGTMKGGSPLDQAIAGMLKGAGQPQAAPQQGGIQPQSFGGQPEQGGIVPVQTGTAPQAAPDEPMVTTPLGPMPKSKAAMMGLAFAANGKGDASKLFADPNVFGKEAQNKLDEKMINTGEQISRLNSVAQRFDPNLLTYEGRFKGGWLGVVDAFKSGNKSMKPEDRKYLADFTAMRAESVNNLNSYIKEMTGAAMTEAEAKRLMMAMPNAGTGVFDGDSPTQFKTKLDVVVGQAKMAMARAQFAKANNKAWNSIPLEQMPTIIQQRGAQLWREMRSQAPKASDQDLGVFVDQRMKQEFGI